MYRKISAEYIFDGNDFHQNKMIVLDGDVVVDFADMDNAQDIEKYDGILCPGFVNTHCHLELSHLKGRVDTGTGLLPFLQKVVQFRDIEPEIISKAIETQDRLMWENGIQAVGDISNQADTAMAKTKSPIRYYTFVEMFDFLQEKLTDTVFAQYKEVFEQHSDQAGNKKSAVPHAPYTVTPELFRRINSLNTNPSTISIHNQETADEDAYFEDKSGGFSQFFKSFAFDDDDFLPTGKKSIYYALDHMDSMQKTIFVHNTQTKESEIVAAQNWNAQVYWATCPRANLYIENRLPNYHAFIKQNAKMTIGTDSLSSNWSLSIWEEIKTIHKYNSYISLNTLLQWGTRNGAEALSMDDELGGFEQGMKPGVIHIESADPLHFIDGKIHRII